MKKNVPSSRSIRPSLLQIILIMKLFIICLFFTVLQVQAKEVNGQNINLHVNQTEIRKVLTAVEKQTAIRFLYNYDLKALKKKVDFTAQDLPVPDALDKLFENSGLTYKKVNENLIAVVSENPDDNKAIRITGRITGENAEPLSGVSVNEKGTTNGTVSDNEGQF